MQIKTKKHKRTLTLKRRRADDQQPVSKEELSIINHEGIASQATVRWHITLVRMAVTTENEDSKC